MVDDTPMFKGDKPHLILSNHINVLDFVYLAHFYCPLFTKVVLYIDCNGNRKAGVSELGMFEVITHAMGIKFPQIVEGKINERVVFKDLKSLAESKYV